MENGDWIDFDLNNTNFEDVIYSKLFYKTWKYFL